MMKIILIGFATIALLSVYPIYAMAKTKKPPTEHSDTEETHSDTNTPTPAKTSETPAQRSHDNRYRNTGKTGTPTAKGSGENPNNPKEEQGSEK